MIKKETIHIFIYQCQFLHICEECKEDGDCTGATNKCADNNTCKCGNTAACSGSTPVCVDDACKGNPISTSMNCVFFKFFLCETIYSMFVLHISYNSALLETFASRDLSLLLLAYVQGF